MPLVFNPFTGTFDFTGSGGSSSNSFTIMQPDTGTSPTASSSTDTLTFHNSDGQVSISGNSSTKTLTFNLSAMFAPADSPTFTTKILFGSARLDPQYHDDGNSSTAVTVDWKANGGSQKITLTASNPTITLSNPQAGTSYLLAIYTGAGSFTTPTFSPALKGSSYTTTLTAGKVDWLPLFYDGSNYWLFTPMLNVS